MKIRSSIENITTDLQRLISQEDCVQKIAVPGRLAEAQKAIEETLDAYVLLEKSPKGRVATLQPLSAALRGLAGRVNGAKSLPKRVLGSFGLCQSAEEKRLYSWISKVEGIWKRSKPGLLERFIHWCGEKLVRLGLHSHECSLQHRVKECAFRTLKGLGFLELLAMDPRIQGAPPYLSYKSIIKDVEGFLEQQRTLLTNEQIAELEGALSLLRAGEAIAFDKTVLQGGNQCGFKIDAKISDLSYELEKAIENLAVGKSLIVPGGYFKENEGHAVVYEIRRNSEDHYQFTIFNTGDGALFGQGFFDMLGMLWNGKVGAVVFSHLSQEAVSDQKFLSALLRFATVPSPSHSMDEVHRTLKEHLVDRHNGVQSVREKHDLQTWGTCAFDSILSYLETRLSPELFLPLQLTMMKHARNKLDQLLPRARKEETFNKETLDLLDKKSKEAIADAKSKYSSFFEGKDCWIQELSLRTPEALKAHLQKLQQRRAEIVAQSGDGWLLRMFGNSEHVKEKGAIDAQLDRFRRLLPAEASVEERSSQLFSLMRQKQAAFKLFQRLLPR